MRKKTLIGAIIIILVIVIVVIYMAYFRTYSVYFDTKMGTSIKTEEVKKNETVTKPVDPTSTGYTFRGWYLDGEEFDFNTKITKDITLTAEWEKTE